MLVCLSPRSVKKIAGHARQCEFFSFAPENARHLRMYAHQIFSARTFSDRRTAFLLLRRVLSMNSRIFGSERGLEALAHHGNRPRTSVASATRPTPTVIAAARGGT